MAFVLSDLDTFRLGYFGSTGDVGVYRRSNPSASVLFPVGEGGKIN
jgi:hypothetical protein